jgi:hypothetical protein
MMALRNIDVDQKSSGKFAAAYRGSATVCSVHLIPIAGHEVDSSVIKYLESNDVEIEFVFIPEAHMLLPIGASLPTLIGTMFAFADEVIE